jgi:hypothetical protein
LSIGTTDRWRVSRATPITSRHGTLADGVGGRRELRIEIRIEADANALATALSPGQTRRAIV